MNTASLALALSLSPLLASCVAGAKNAVNVQGAYRSISGDFKGATVSPAVGIEGLLGLTTEGIGLEGGFLYSENDPPDGSGEVLETNELYAGARKTWNTTEQVQPYIAAGANWMGGEVDAPLDFEFSGNGLGVYVRGGVGFQFDWFQFGFDLRGAVSGAKVDDESLSYVQAGLFVGTSF